MSHISSHTELVVFIFLGIGCLLTFAFLQYKSRQSISRTLRRLFFLLVTLVGLGLLVLRPERTLTMDKRSGQVGIDITTDDSYASIHELLADRPELYDTLHVDPVHTTMADLEISAELFSVIPLVDSNSWGIIDLSMPNRIVENESWQLSGAVTPKTDRISIKNQLSDKEERTIVEDGRFTISTSTSFAGHQLYDLTAYSDLGDSISYSIAIEVVTDEPWQLMALTSYPSAEINTLKNYWVNDGNGFFWRTSVSTGRYRVNSINTTLDNLDDIKSKTLRSFDFLLTDIPTWNQLSPQERKTINGQIYSQGLGLIIIPTEVEQTAVDINHPQIIDYSDNQELSSASQYNFGSGWNSIRSGTESYGRYQDYGLGRRLILSHDKTYQLVLADEDVEYDHIWSSILSAAYNSYQSISKILAKQWVWSGERTDLYLITDQPINGEVLLNDSINITPVDNPLINQTYLLTLWPEPGYNTISYNDEQLRFYSHDSDDWPLVRSQHLTRAMELTEAPIVTRKYESKEPYSPLIGLILLISGLGMLWLDERLYQ